MKIKSVLKHELLKEDRLEITSLTALNKYSSLLKSSNLFSSILNKQIQIKYDSLITICKLSSVIPEELALFAFVIEEVKPILSNTASLIDDDAHLNVSLRAANSQHDLQKQEYLIPNYSIKKLNTSFSRDLNHIPLKNDFMTKHRIISFIYRSIYIIYFLYALLLLIEITVFYLKHKYEFLLFEGLVLALIISLLILGSLGLNVFKRQLFQFLIYLNIGHVILIGLTVFTIVVPIEKILTSTELYDFVYMNLGHYFMFVSLTLFQLFSVVINIVVWKQASQLKQKTYHEEIPMTEI